MSVASRDGDISSVLQGGFPRRQCNAPSGSAQGVARRDLDRTAIFVAMVLIGFAIVPAPTPLFVVGAHRQVGEPRLARSQERPLHGTDRVPSFELQVATLRGGRGGRDAQAGGDLHVPSALFMRGRQPRGEADPSSVFPRPLAVTIHIGSVPDAKDDVTSHAADGVAGRDFDLAGVPVAGLAGADAHVPRQARAEASVQVREGVRGVELQAAGAGIPVGRAGVTVGVMVVVGVDPPVGSRVVGVVILIGDREGLVCGVPDARGDLDVASLVGQAATSADGHVATGRFLGVASLEVQETPVVGPVLALVLDEYVLVQLVLVDLPVQLVQSVSPVELDSVVSRQHDALAGVQVDVAVIEPDILGGAAHPVRFPAPGGDVDVATVPRATETRVELDGAGGQGRVAREDGDVPGFLLSLAGAEEDPPAHTQVGPVGGLAGGLGVPGVGGGERDVAGSGEVAAPGKPRDQVDAAPVVVLGGAPGDGDVASVAHAVGAELEEVVIGSVPERRQEGGPVGDPGAVASSEVDLASDPESSPAGFHDDGSSAGGEPPGTLQRGVILDGRVSGREGEERPVELAVLPGAEGDVAPDALLRGGATRTGAVEGHAGVPGGELDGAGSPLGAAVLRDELDAPGVDGPCGAGPAHQRDPASVHFGRLGQPLGHVPAGHDQVPSEIPSASSSERDVASEPELPRGGASLEGEPSGHRGSLVERQAPLAFEVVGVGPLGQRGRSGILSHVAGLQGDVGTAGETRAGGQVDVPRHPGGRVPRVQRDAARVRCRHGRGGR